jgi:hypothetical protein
MIRPALRGRLAGKRGSGEAGKEKRKVVSLRFSKGPKLRVV